MLNQIFDIIITSLCAGVRFIPLVCISELFGGRYTPLPVKSSLIALLGFYRYFIVDRTLLPYGFNIKFVFTEFVTGYLITAPFILLTKFIINSSSTIENLFGNMSPLNSQGIFDERGSSLEMIFEMIVITIIFVSGVHIFLLKLLMEHRGLNLDNQVFYQITITIIKHLSILSRDTILYFAPLVILSIATILILAFSDTIDRSLNLSSSGILINSIIILVGIILLLKNICSLLQADIFRIAGVSRTIAEMMK